MFPKDRNISVYIFDLDGVIYLGETPFPDSASTIASLARAGHKIYYLTNNSGRSRADYQAKLSRMDIPVRPEQIFTSAYATALYLKSQGAAGKNAYVVGMSGIVSELAAMGINPVTATDVLPYTQIDYVVVGIDRQFNYEKLRFAHAAITRGHAQYIATNLDATFPMEEGEIPGGGSIAASITTSTSRQPFVVGKPQPYALQAILDDAGVSPGQAILVGDRLDTDIAAGNNLGVPTVLVLTGVTTRSMADEAPSLWRPTRIIGKLGDLLEE
ncbi:MAG TPA: HAD-IIA family hydrolase [Capsulimonadaceae bacterium]|nr:HAD-IIA family hydrolase [Capsulimonadaceae bacterium]